jgi:hypothetical protein
LSFSSVERVDTSSFGFPNIRENIVKLSLTARGGVRTQNLGRRPRREQPRKPEPGEKRGASREFGFAASI